MLTGKPERSQLGELLVEMGLVDRDQLAVALSHQRNNGGRLGRILAERRLVDEDRLAKAIAARLGLEAVNLSTLKIHERVLALIPANIALKYGALPIAIKRTNQAEFVYVVMADPLDSEALSELARVSGREIRVLVATATELDRALEQHYRPTAVRPPPTEAISASMTREKSAVAPAAAPVAPAPPAATPRVDKTDPGKRGLPAPSSPPPPMPGAGNTGRLRVPGQNTAQNVPPLPSAGAKVPTPPGTPVASPPHTPLPQGSPQPPRALPSHKTAPPISPSRTGANPLPRPEGTRPEGSAPRFQAPSVQTPVLPRPPAPVPSSVPRATAPSGGTTLPPLRPPGARDTQQEGTPAFETKKPALPPLQAPRIPTAEQDPTFPHEGLGPLGEDLKVGAIAGDVENTLGEWDRAVRDWPRPSISSQQSISSTATLPPIDRSALADTVSPQPTITEPVVEPITKESALKDLSAEEPQQAIASDVPTSIPAPRDAEEVHVEILEVSEGGDDIKTSQVDVDEDFELQILRGVLPDSLSRPGGIKRGDRSFALEIPVDISDAPSPFEGPESVEIPVGLERTGIIPAIDWEKEEFVPPPLVRGPVSPMLVGLDDIPTSSAAVRARSEGSEPAGADHGAHGDHADRALDEITLDPAHGQKPEPRFDTLLEARAAAQKESIDLLDEEEAEEKPEELPPRLQLQLEPEPPAAAAELELEPVEDSDASDMPVIEPSSLVSLIDEDGTSKEADTGNDRAPVLRPDPSSVQPVVPPPAPTRLFDEQDRQLSPVRPTRPAKRELEEEETNPRIDGNSVRAALAAAQQQQQQSVTSQTLVDEPLMLVETVDPVELVEPVEPVDDKTPPRNEADRDRVLDDLEGMFIASAPRGEPARPVISDSAPDNADRMVEALLSGDSLNSAERAQLVLAIGRALVKKGLLTREDLAGELKK